MGRLLLRRLLQSVVLIAGVLTLVFLTNFVIGDPARAMLPPETPHDEYLKFRHQMGFDRPIPVQYFDFARHAVVGNFGDSLWQRAPALPIALHPLPATLLLAVFSIALALVVGLPLGILASLRPGSLLDRLAVFVALIGVSLPLIWLGLILILIFSVKLGWLPTSGYGTWQHLILPGISLAALPLGRIAQIARSAMIDELAQQYITTAHAKGLARRTVIFRHALKNAAIPIITVAGWEFILMVAGYTIIVETVFGWPGIGYLLYNAIQNRDSPLVEATVFVISVVVTAVNLLVDMLYAMANPQVQYG
ncbi:MAG: ABC transporter permease [Thermomicrobiales bacterium]